MDMQGVRCWIERGVAVIAVVTALSVSMPLASAQESISARPRSAIAARARSAVGAPYSYGGSSVAGFDCSGFTMWVFAEHGIALPHSSSAQYALGGSRGYERVALRSRLKVGDLVFHDTSDGAVGHAGIYMGRGRFVSATSSEGVRTRSLYDSYWGPRWVGGVRAIDDARSVVKDPRGPVGRYAAKLDTLENR